MIDPYVGPRPFERDEAGLFFGRLGETRLLVSMVLASRVVLLYALSGAGKTSLLNAAVVPSLEREDFFEVLPPARVRGPATEAQPAAGVNPYVTGVLSHWTGDGAASLPARLGQLPHPNGPDGFPPPSGPGRTSPAGGPACPIRPDPSSSSAPADPSPRWSAP